MKLKPGFYKQRNGGKAEVVAARSGGVAGYTSVGVATAWRADGLHHHHKSLDLIEEWRDPFEAWAIADKKTGQIYRQYADKAKTEEEIRAYTGCCIVHMREVI